MRSDQSRQNQISAGMEPRPASPAPSGVSLRSDKSMYEPLNFRNEESRPASPAPSGVSLRSDKSMYEPLNFRNEESRPASPAPSGVSLRSDMSMYEPLNFRNEESSPVQEEKPVTSWTDSGSMTRYPPEDDPLDFRKDTDAKRSLVQDGMSRILAKYEKELKHVEMDSELYEIAKDKKQGDKVVQTYKDIFKSKKKPVRTVLTKGVAGVGKTYQTRMFMIDWAKGESNRNIDLIVPLHFSELNARRDKVQSMENLLNHFLNDGKQTGIFSYQCKLTFVLDGLENCELPLDFKENDKLTDVKEPASMDVLLTNLITGNLLPTAQLWIISQPSGIQKIPDKYIHKVTECRDTDAKRRVTREAKNRILAKYEKELKHVEMDSKLYEIAKDEKQGDKVVQTYNDIFKSKKKPVRTVLTKGVAGVGKTYQTGMFMIDWAKGESNRNIDLIVPLHFSELNARRDKVQSMDDLLNHFLNDGKQTGIFSYQCKLAFVLDGLEDCKLPLDFEKNRKVTDVKEPASMDELLTNLITGNLLPTAQLWIISQPSGVHKIPPEHIEKVTECRETLKRRQQLVSKLRERFIRENAPVEDLNHPNQKNTEHVMREDGTDEVADDEKNGQKKKAVIQVNAVSDIFKDGKQNKRPRTVLTVGEIDIGKSFHVQKYVKAWAENKCSWFTSMVDKGNALINKGKELEVIFPLNLFQLDLINGTKVSLVGLLNHFFKETKEFVISNYALFNLVFVLDELDAYRGPLDFANNDSLTDVREPASVDVLLTNLIKGNLLPSARVWITSRPSAAKQLPDDCVDRKTEIREKPDLASQRKLKSQLSEQFTHVSEGIDKQKTSALLNEIYTDLYIIEGERGEVNNQNESGQVLDAKFKPEGQETSIKYCDIFKPTSAEKMPIKTVLTIGLAGIGKSFASMKYMLDWAEGTAVENTYYTFPLPFRELNLRRDKEYSFEELLHQFFPGMENSEITDYNKYRILIVLDGLDECRPDLEFNGSTHLTDVTKPTSVSVLLTNLILGNLLPKAQIWITSRPGAANHIPADKVHRVTEVRGFNDEQKEEYFRRRFSDKDLAENILSHVKKSRSLYIMCHIPVFCWITSQVLEDFVTRNQEEGLPKTLTDMYIYFLLLQCRQASVKYSKGESSETDSCWNTGNKETILSLGKLAFDELEKGNLLFTEDNLSECGIDITNAAVFSGLFTQIKREGRGLYQQKLFCFVHLSIQEFLAALYVFHTFNNNGENLPSWCAADSPADFYQKAMDKSLENGNWDLFLRFLLGLSLETNQNLLQELLKMTVNTNNKEINQQTVEYIKKKISEDISDADRNLNLFHCLNELNDHSLVKEVKKCLQSETLAFENFSTSQWSALTYVMLTSDEKLEEFDLKKYLKSEKVLLGMLPVVKVSKTTLLSWCKLTEQSCNGLTSSVLSSASSNLTELDLSHNDLLDSGIQRLADGLKSLHCKLENLNLAGCQVTEEGCSFLASAFKSNPTSHLKKLDLSYNHPGDNGKRMLTAIVEDPNIKLETVCLEFAGKHRLKPGLKKYGAYLKLDEDTAGRRLVLLEENRKVKTVSKVEEKLTRHESKKRFMWSQVLCDEGLKGLCYWEMEWKGIVGIAVAYERVDRKTLDRSGGLGCTELSWSLVCSETGYTAKHGEEKVPVPVEKIYKKIAVFLDSEGGTLSYYGISSGELNLIHTFHAKFTDPLFPGFWFKGGSVTLCDVD